MADVYKVLQPAKYLKEFISKKVRPDGRTFDQCKVAVVHPAPISTAEGSSVILLGDTKVCCGIKAELTTPRPETPSAGFVVTNLEMPPLCSSLFKTGAPGDVAQSINQLLTDIFNDSKCIDLNELCIVKQKMVWVIYCDLVCLNYGGSIIDASLIALITALKTVCLPTISYNENTENCVVDEEKRIPLNIYKFPVSTTFCTFERDIILANPSNDEEQQCGGMLGGTIIVWGLNVDKNNKKDEMLGGIHQQGSAPISQDNLQKAISLAKNRSLQIRSLVDAAIQSKNNKNLCMST